jgi:YegS/Rv2252/BmrU family lipid kinase
VLSVKALLIYNPFSGKGIIGSRINEILRYLKDYEVSIFHSNYEKEITSYLFYNGQRFDLIVLFGGDGTLNEAINGLMRINKRPKLLYIPAGSINDFAKFVGLKKNYHKCFSLLKEEPKKIDICQINEDYFIYVLGSGKFTPISYDYNFYYLKKYLGKYFYFLKAVKEVFKKYKFNLRISSFNKEYSGSYFLFLALNIDNVAGIKINKEKARINDGKIVLYLFKYHRFLSLVSLSCFFLFRRKFSYFIEELEEENFKIICDQNIDLNLDGELRKDINEIKIKVIKEAIEIYY